LSSWLGYAAEDIRITGLQRMNGAAVLNAIGVKPGGSLIGFDANTARKLLLNLDWVTTAKVRVLPPNRLDVEVSEREPFAIWQRGGLYYVIDREGVAVASLNVRKFTDLLLVSGDGAETTASQLVNQLEVWPDIHSSVKGAARVGKRRWTLYFSGGRQALLPENGVETALAVLADMQARHKVLSSGIRVIDLRLAGSAVLVPFEGESGKAAEKVASR
jgi:cell division protein FtsQ